MSFTRFHDDPNRIQKTNLETSAINDYVFNVPGNTNDQLRFIEDPHIRSQTNGTPLYRNMIQTESKLRGMERLLCRDHHTKNNHQKDVSIFQTKTSPYMIKKTITKESRASHPAWSYRTKSQYFPSYLLYDPQKNIEIPFDTYLDTNILEKDYYTHKKI